MEGKIQIYIKTLRYINGIELVDKVTKPFKAKVCHLCRMPLQLDDTIFRVIVNTIKYDSKAYICHNCSDILNLEENEYISKEELKEVSIVINEFGEALSEFSNPIADPCNHQCEECDIYVGYICVCWLYL